MKPAYFCKLLCLLLAVVFLTGCTEKEFDPETDDFAVIVLDANVFKITNPEGEDVYWSRKQKDPMPPPKGTMAFSSYKFDVNTGGMDITLTVPYRKSFTAHPKLPQTGIPPRFYARFNKGNMWVSDIYVSGAFLGPVTAYDNNVVELSGSSSDIIIEFYVHEEENRDSTYKTSKYLYRLMGSGENAKIRLKGDEIVTEGMVGDYTVAKSEIVKSYPDSSGNWEEVYTKTYSEDGKEK